MKKFIKKMFFAGQLSIADKLFYSIIIILTIILGILGFFLIQREVATLTMEAEERIDRTVNFLESTLPRTLWKLDVREARQIIELGSTKELVEVELFDEKHERIYVYERDQEEIVYDLAIERALTYGQRKIGYVKIYFTRKDIERIRIIRILQLSILVIVTGLVLASSLYFMNRRLIVKPISKMLALSNKLAQGIYRERLIADRNDEMGTLQRSLNHLAQALEESVTMLETRREEADIARQEAQEAFKVRSEFLANMSHEIRTPMNAIIGFAELLLESEIDDEQKGKIQTIQNSANNLLQLINSILDFSKIEAGKLNLSPTIADIRNVTGDALMLIRHELERKDVELLSEISPETPRLVFIDQVRLRQIILNLLGNAVKFTNSGEIKLKVDVLQSDNERATLQFVIEDSGIGIPKDKLDIIFMPFVQADSSKTREFGGTGLGLPICKRLVELMGGDIWVESEENKGSKFCFTITVGLAMSA
ncbi:HAMP domain-containing protein [bacterium]|nr:HAMP domain-containing protein [bacterium]